MFRWNETIRLIGLVQIAVVIFVFGVQRCNCQSQGFTPPQKDIIVTTVRNEPFLRSIKNLQGQDDYEGYTVDLAEKLFDKLGLSYKFKLVEDGKYGTKDNRTGEWNGMIGELVSKESDMAIADLSITAERSEVVDFSAPFMTAQLAILAKTPPKRGSSVGSEGQGQRSTNFFPWIEPMTLWFWLTFTLTCLFLLFLTFFTEKIVSRQIGKVQPPPPEPLFAAFGTRVFGRPKSVATRILQVTFWIFLAFVFCAYASNFAADKILDLVHESESTREPLAINSVEELVEYGEHIRVGTLLSGSTSQYIKTSEDPMIARLNEKITRSGQLLDNYERGVQKVKNSNGNFVFIMESVKAQYTTLKVCEVTAVRKLFGPTRGYGIAIPKDSRKLVLNKITAAILELNEEGILDNLAERWFKDQSECDNEAQGKINIDKVYAPLTMDSMASLFILLTISVFVVFIVAGIETGLNRKTEQVT